MLLIVPYLIYFRFLLIKDEKCDNLNEKKVKFK
jgi:hypothetical protein